MFDQRKLFVTEGRRRICHYFPGYVHLTHGQFLGYVSAPLVHSSLSANCLSVDDGLHEDISVSNDTTVSTSHEHAAPMMAAVSDDTTDPEPPDKLLRRWDLDQCACFMRVWEEIPPHLRHITFDIDGPEWTVDVIYI